MKKVDSAELFMAAYKGPSAKIIELIADGADQNIRYNDESTKWTSWWFSSVRFLAGSYLFMRHGWNLKTTFRFDEESKTDKVSLRDSMPAEELKEKAQPNQSANQPWCFGANYYRYNKTGWTPLHFAASSGNSATAKVLLGRGANIFALSDDGKTFLEIAGELGNDDFLVNTIEHVFQILQQEYVDMQAIKYLTNLECFGRVLRKVKNTAEDIDREDAATPEGTHASIINDLGENDLEAGIDEVLEEDGHNNEDIQKDNRTTEDDPEIEITISNSLT